MLEQILDYIHNYFEKDRVEGEFTIDSGSIDVDFLQPNQYFKIVGSVFNDGVHRYQDQNDVLTDETFNGQIWPMAVPPALMVLVGDIEDWIGQFGEVVYSPYQSESFGGYSYTKKSGASGGGNQQGAGFDWQNVFRSRLNHWRKIS